MHPIRQYYRSHKYKDRGVTRVIQEMVDYRKYNRNNVFEVKTHDRTKIIVGDVIRIRNKTIESLVTEGVVLSVESDGVKALSVNPDLNFIHKYLTKHYDFEIIR